MSFHFILCASGRTVSKTTILAYFYEITSELCDLIINNKKIKRFGYRTIFLPCEF